MLLKKIRTKGFLGHLTGEAENDFVELDFADKNLWLIQGVNGAGKSTLFDAITLAFFKQHRGGKQNLEKLIHDKADQAEVFVEFELYGNNYRGAVNIPKDSSPKQLIQFWNGISWETKAQTEKEVKDWVTRNLKISYETFVSSILLQQGRADKFITEGPTSRRKIFLELLQLEIYTKLTKKAKERQDKVKEDLEKIKQSLVNLENPTAKEIKNQEDQVKQLSKELESLEKGKSVKQKEFDDAKRVQKLKQEIEEIEAQQKSDAELFENAAQVEEKYRYFVELKENLLRIENVWREKKEIERIKEDFQANESKINELNKELQNVSDNLNKNLSAHEKAESELIKLENQLNSAKAKREATRQKLDEILLLENLERQIGQADEGLQKTRKSIAEANQKLGEIEARFNEKTAEKDEIESWLQESETDFRVWSDRLENRRKVVDKDECPACGNELKREETRQKLIAEYEEAGRKVDELKRIKIDLNGKLSEAKNQLSEISAEREIANKKHQALLQTETGFKTKIETLQSQLTVLYAADEREAIRREFAEMQNQIADFESRFKTAKENSEELRKIVGELEKSKARFEADLKNAREYLKTLQEREQKIKNDLTEAENKIYGDWRNHVALQDETELENLRREKNDLRDIEAEYEVLREAQKRQENLEGQKKTVTKQLKEIPENHWREVSQVEAEFNKIVERIGIVKFQFNDADNLCRKMTEDKKRYDEKSFELKSVKEDFEIWKKLVKALGKDGLETKVVREAQLKISENANKTLKALSSGNFQIELEDSGKEMKIFVRDFSTGELRQIEYFSGGEKFLTAVSLAVAIGQSASGQNIANTLIIDEGFGALDDKNRGLMVQVLPRLSERLQNARIIVVSHQDDVQESFANRFRLEKTGEGVIKVQLAG
ncbi:MAG TPA: SMC family ATPase [Pyrinomonadaceae bacterium]|jgi:exonuclease SbcC